jgi:predicted GNAT family N-acyltransferase
VVTVTSVYSYRLVADEAELEAALDLRRQVFVEEQGISRQLEFDGLDNQAIHIVAMDGDNVIGTARVRFLDDCQARIERMAVSKPFRRKGIGRGIVSLVIAESKKRGARHLILHAQLDAVSFYRSCGFEEAGKPFWEARIKHVEMEMWL